MKWVLEPKQQVQYPSFATPRFGPTPDPSVRSQANPYDAVALKALAQGSARVHAGLRRLFNEPGSPWLKMFETAVYNHDQRRPSPPGNRDPVHAGHR